jgi:tRNA-binding protein
MSQESPPAQAGPDGQSGLSSPEEFFRTEVHVGRVVKAENFPAARKPAYRLLIDFGPLGEKRSSAQITARYTPDELVGRLVVAVTNFPPRQIATFMSEVLVLGVPDDTGEVILLRPDTDVAPGTRVF